ncbi:Ribosomal protein L29 [Carpediemonas membranifera]|uniref:Ribosomal protein L29 n=1 Tax=Carpediemonas membranifera TaxID=201153 RepID=A0A8J6B9J4_9EUKA|nr:Ribosomal protein L29 [Carpediemonas membranifera]|eukprot:KAG9395597.1 Ribosomal protein L29 [Carpediemonas membranifera]
MPKLFTSSELKSKTVDELNGSLENLKTELLSLRVAKVTSANPNKLTKLRIVRRQVAQILTELTQRGFAEARKEQAGKKYKSVDLRLKKTRAARRALTKHELSQTALRTIKKQQNFPLRSYHL